MGTGAVLSAAAAAAAIDFAAVVVADFVDFPLLLVLPPKRVGRREAGCAGWDDARLGERETKRLLESEERDQNVLC
jgi:hypothetical protein